MDVFNRTRVRAGMRVIGADGNDVGTVKETRDTDFLLNRPMARDVYVPYSAVKDATNGTLTLNVTSDQIDKQGWTNPPLTGATGR